MAPARNLLLRHCDSYGTFFDRAELLLHERSVLMAEKATQSGAQDELQEEEKEEEAADDQASAEQAGWLQLGAPPPPDPGAAGTSRKRSADQVMELDLFPSRPPPPPPSLPRPASVVEVHGQLRGFWTPSPSSSSSALQSMHPSGTSGPAQAAGSRQIQVVSPPPLPAAVVGVHGRFWTPSPSSSSSALQSMHPSGSSEPAQVAGGSQIQVVSPPPLPAAVAGVHGRFWTPSPSSSSSAMQFMHPSGSSGPPQAAGGSQIQVVSPPSRPQTGLWLVLKAAENQIKQPFLPQIPKSFLRIKDGRMTARLLMKYLADKLGLEDESAVQISCRGQQIPPLMTLQQIRDQIWCPREANLLLPPQLSTTDHLMALHYSRT